MKNMVNTFMYRMMWIAVAGCIIAASTTQAANLVPHPDSDAKFQALDESTFPYKVEVASSHKKDGTATPTKTVAHACETVGRRVYDLCMASPGADRSRCLREYDDAYLRCSHPPRVDDPKEETSTSELSQGIYRIPYADDTKVHISRDFYDHNPPGKIDMAGRGSGYRFDPGSS